MPDLKAALLRAPGAMRAVKSSPVQRLLATARRRGCVGSGARFAAMELLGPPGRVARHELPGGRVSVVLRHRSRDVEIFDEIFVEPSAYELPPAVAGRLNGPLQVLDLGGNIGLFGAFALQQLDVAGITSFEPDPTNLSLLRRCRELNPRQPWNIVEAAAGTAAGALRFAAGGYADSHVAFAGETGDVEVRVVDVFEALAAADLVKIDIEGSEWPLLLDRRLAELGPTVLVLEWHALNCPGPDAFSCARDALEQAGFTVWGMDHGYDHGSLWAWNAA